MAALLGRLLAPLYYHPDFIDRFRRYGSMKPSVDVLFTRSGQMRFHTLDSTPVGMQPYLRAIRERFWAEIEDHNRLHGQRLIVPIAEPTGHQRALGANWLDLAYPEVRGGR